jgi:hypothetical protein
VCDCQQGYAGNPYLADGCQGWLIQIQSLWFSHCSCKSLIAACVIWLQMSTSVSGQKTTAASASASTSLERFNASARQAPRGTIPNAMAAPYLLCLRLPLLRQVTKSPFYFVFYWSEIRINASISRVWMFDLSNQPMWANPHSTWFYIDRILD